MMAMVMLCVLCVAGRKTLLLSAMSVTYTIVPLISPFVSQAVEPFFVFTFDCAMFVGRKVVTQNVRINQPLSKCLTKVQCTSTGTHGVHQWTGVQLTANGVLL